MTAVTYVPELLPPPEPFAPEEATPERCLPRRHTVTLFRAGPLLLDCGQPMNNVRVAYHTYGEARPDATLVLHALTGTSAVHEWWPEFLGEGKPLDPSRDYVVCANVLGGCAGSSGPSELPTVGGEPVALTLRDMARVGRELLKHLGVGRVRVIGASMGGMLAYAWLLECPDLVERGRDHRRTGPPFPVGHRPEQRRPQRHCRSSRRRGPQGRPPDRHAQLPQSGQSGRHPERPQHAAARRARHHVATSTIRARNWPNAFASAPTSPSRRPWTPSSPATPN